VEPPIMVSAQGTITPPSSPGLGFEVKEKYLEQLSVRTEAFKLTNAADVTAV